MSSERSTENNEPTPVARVRANAQATPEPGRRLTSHLSFRENKVLKKNTIQITGQTMRPSQKMRASASVAATWSGDACWGGAGGGKQGESVSKRSALPVPPLAHAQAWRRTGGRGGGHRIRGGSPPPLFHGRFPARKRARGGPYLPGLENPVAFPILVYLVPPAEAHQESPGYVLHGPEVKGQEEEHGDEAARKASAEPVTAHIGDNGAHSEKQVEEGGQRVPRKEPRSPLTAKAKRAVLELALRVRTC